MKEQTIHIGSFGLVQVQGKALDMVTKVPYEYHWIVTVFLS